MVEIDPADPELNALRQQAIDRAAVLMQHLDVDRVDLQQRPGTTDSIDIDSGVEAIGRAIAAAERVRDRLQAG
jgi:hypothetical protein